MKSRICEFNSTGCELRIFIPDSVVEDLLKDRSVNPMPRTPKSEIRRFYRIEAKVGVIYQVS